MCNMQKNNEINESDDLQIISHDLEGLDSEAAKTWIYPTNYPVRDYQYNIIEKALLKNTLVSLPTGLGKTFIAAVVMYNFFRWYPWGKVIFMAPTRPLVKQQVDACYDIMAIPQQVTAELTGSNLLASREEIWKEKRVFFITPQILQNDLSNIVWLGQKIKCIVFDEAHKAKGNHAYCEVIRKLWSVNKDFRVLALSATPGANVPDCLEIIQNLMIAHLEFRTEESPDVKQYIFQRNLTTVVVPLGDKLQQIKDDYLKILDTHTRNLVKYKVINANYGSLTKGKIFMTMRHFQECNKNSSNYSEIMKSLNVCVTLYHAYELLIRHWLRSFNSFFKDHINKPLLRNNVKIIEIMEDISQYLGPPLQHDLLPDGNFSEISKDVKFGHPKFYKLRDILVENFQEKGDASKVIVFFEYRESVLESHALLWQYRPLLRPRVFLGQKNGITQKNQLNVVKAFRSNECNVLLSTCIGEEGIDVGDVDLIVCFDISNKSPIRMVQRMGRTGRKKEGRIIVLVTEGKEQQTLKDCLIHKNNVTYHVLNSKEINKGLIKECPQMLLDAPKCEKIYITVKKQPLRKNSSLKDMFRKISSSSELQFSPNLDLRDVPDRLPNKTVMLWNKTDPLNTDADFTGILSKKIAKQRSFQDGTRVQHSKDSTLLVSLLQLTDSKRFNIPSTQMENGFLCSGNRNLKQIDIRNMFVKSNGENLSPLSQGFNMQTPSSLISEEKFVLGPKSLLDEMTNFLTIKSLDVNKCQHCFDYFDCSKIIKPPTTSKRYTWVELDSSLFTKITPADMAKFGETENKNVEISSSLVDGDFGDLQSFIGTSILDEFLNKSAQFEAPRSFSEVLDKYGGSIMESKEVITTQMNKNLDLEASQKKVGLNKAAQFEAPGSLSPILRKCGGLMTELEVLNTHVNEKVDVQTSPKKNIVHKAAENLSGVLDKNDGPIKESEEVITKMNETVELEVSQENIEKEKPNIENIQNNEVSPDDNLETVLKFFKLNTLLEIFQDEHIFSSQDTIIYSPDIFKDAARTPSPVNNYKHIINSTSQELVKSPSFVRSSVRTPSPVLSMKTRVVRNELVKTPSPRRNSMQTPSPVLNMKSRTVYAKENNKTLADPFFTKSSTPLVKPQQTLSESHLTLHDFCDESILEVVAPIKKIDTLLNTTGNISNLPAMSESYKVEDFCVADNSKKNSESDKVSDCHLSDIEDICDISLMRDFKKFENQAEKKHKTPVKYDENPTSCASSSKANQKLSSPGREKINEKQKMLDLTLPSQVTLSRMLSYANKTFSESENPISSPNKVPSCVRHVSSPDLFDDSVNKKETPKKKLFIHSHNRTLFDLTTNANNSNSHAHTSIPMVIHETDSEDDFQPLPKVPIRPRVTSVKRKKLTKKVGLKKRKSNEFIENEAEVSINSSAVISDDEVEMTQEENYDPSFVSDEHHIVNTQMYGEYVKTTRSPIRNRGNFKIPVQLKENNENIYSQDFQQDETYLNDSFVVSGDEVESCDTLSDLDIMEMELERKEKKKRIETKKKRIETKKKKKFVIDDDSD